MVTRWYSSIFKDQATADHWIPILEEQRKKYYGSEVTQTVSSLPLINFDALYAENCKTGAKLLPIGHDDEGDSIEDFKKIIFQSATGDLTFVAQCKCGAMQGNYHLGDVCPKCRTKVETSFANDINIRAWIELPESVPPFLHPVAYRVLNNWIGIAKHKVSILDAIMNVEVDLPEPYNHGPITQGIWNFHKNFWDIIRYIASTHKGQKAANDAVIMEFLETYKDCLFTRHIPILNQSLHILTHNGSMQYNDESSKHILGACIELNEVIKQQRHQPRMTLSNRNYYDQQIFNAFKAWTDYTNSIIDDKLIHKSGFIRKNNLGTRLHWTGRGVIVPITNRHWADEIELPWRMTVGLFKLEILNKLRLNYGFDLNTAMKYWQQAQIGIKSDMPEGREKEYVKECVNYVKTALDQLLAECPFKGFPIIMGRNPTLRHGETKSSHTREIWYRKCA